MKRIGIGYKDYREFIDPDRCYVDKTRICFCKKSCIAGLYQKMIETVR